MWKLGRCGALAVAVLLLLRSAQPQADAALHRLQRPVVHVVHGPLCRVALAVCTAPTSTWLDTGVFKGSRISICFG